VVDAQSSCFEITFQEAAADAQQSDLASDLVPPPDAENAVRASLVKTSIFSSVANAISSPCLRAAQKSVYYVNLADVFCEQRKMCILWI